MRIISLSDPIYSKAVVKFIGNHHEFESRMTCSVPPEGTMNLIKSLLMIGLIWGSSLAGASFPPNDLHLQDNLHAKDANMTEVEFNNIIDLAVEHYASVIESHGATLKFNRLWTNSTVNASAQQSGSTWIVNMYGGLARRPEVTPDGFALVVCHELGHHLAGYPLYNRGFGNWASNEGQSDYFASQACARKIWGAQKLENSLFRSTVDPLAKEGCDAAWATEEDQNLCYRVAMAGHSLASLLGALRQSPAVSFSTPDQNQVAGTSDGHPQAQCRLDTYYQGALCDADFDTYLIPGRNHPEGQRSEGAEAVAAENSCTRAAFDPMGTRPRCWFKPLTAVRVSLTDILWSELTGNSDGVIQPGESFSITSSLANGTRTSFEVAEAKLETENDFIEVVNGESQYSSVEPGATKEQDEPFVIKVREDAVCGQYIDLDLSLILGGTVHKESTRKRLGRVVGSVPYTKTPLVAIPDNNAQGVKSVISVAEGEGAVAVRLKSKIVHTYIGDLTVTLTSPSGQEFTLHNKEGGSTDNLLLDREISLVGQQAIGDWTLKVVDSGRRDFGELESWSLEFSQATCE